MEHKEEENHHSHSHDHDQEHDHHDHHAHMIKEFKAKFWICLVLTLPILSLAPMIQEIFGFTFAFPYSSYVLAGLSTFVYFYGGWPFIKGMGKEVKGKEPGMMTLIGIAITVAWAYSFAVTLGIPGKTFYWELASLIVIMLLGHWIEMRSVMGASNALDELAALMPDTARVLDEKGTEKEVQLSELSSGDVLVIRAGEKIPADGRIKEGSSSINESMLTGESVPVEKGTGEEVIGGSINGKGVLHVEVAHTGDEAYLSKVIGMVRKAQESRSKTQDLANKAAFWLTIVSLGVGTLTLLSWWLIVEREFVFALERMVSVMVISCPHALGLAIPLVVAISTSVSARNGLLIRDRTAFEQARNLDIVVFDKTGTLTTGEFGVRKIIPSKDGNPEKEILRIAASLEQSSEHPIASGIMKKAREMNLDVPFSKDVQNITGEGITGKVDDVEYYLVGPGWLRKNELDVPKVEGSEGTTVIHLVHDMKVLGSISLSDVPRETSYEAVRELQKNGIKAFMLTGDTESVASAVSKELGMDGYFAEVLPEEKQEKVKELRAKGNKVAMTGDGVNDAPALAEADVGIAVGSGTDVAAETADIILVNSDPKDISNVILFGRATHRKMVQNLFWAAGYNIVAIPLAAGVLYQQGIMIDPATGAVIMSLSTIIVALNAQLLKRSMAKK